MSSGLKTPKSIMLAGHRIKIVIDQDMEDWGEYSHDKKIIIISYKCLQSRNLFMETLRHEMVHAAFNIAGIGHIQNYEEECIVRCLENLFFPAYDKVKQTFEQMNH